MIRKLVLVASLLCAGNSYAGNYEYEEIAKRFKDAALNSSTVNASKLQGECLVGLKELNFKKKNEFDAVAEWSTFRSSQLLEQFSPCEVLIMMEVAQSRLREK